jgi:hypothetical protein
MKRSGGVIAGACLSIFMLLVMIWRSSLSIQIFTGSAEVDPEYATQHLGATLNLGRILPSIAIVGVIIMVASHLMATRRKPPEEASANQRVHGTR